MAAAMKTPGVYTMETNAFPNSVVEVGTAVPAFVGYTEFHEANGTSLLNRPRVVTSMADFQKLFGRGPDVKYTLATTAPTDTSADPAEVVPAGPVDAVAQVGEGEYFLSRTSQRFYLYYSMLLFYQNGGERCYVVSVGDYEATPDGAAISAGIETLRKEQEPTLVLVPDAVLLDAESCGAVQASALFHCGDAMKNRVAILDVHRGYLPRAATDPISDFREGPIGVKYLDFGAAYYPWVETTMVQGTSLGYENLDNDGRSSLKAILEGEGRIPAEILAGLETPGLETPGLTRPREGDPDAVAGFANARDGATELNKVMFAQSPWFGDLIREIQADLNLLPPSGAIAGVYTTVDNSRGVWKAPANVSLAGVIRAVVSMSDEEQEDLNVTPQGKSVNAIRSLIGEGTLVWGARTLDGNSLDWRYVSVRRTVIMLEQSIQLAARAYVFEPNDASTWGVLKSMIGDFLMGIWKRGGLAGTSPADAFSVHVGLGETMTPDDILRGILRITVLVAVTRPAEFIEITLEQQMQKS